MSIVADEKYRSNMKTVPVAVTVSTDAVVHRCDRCKKEQPRAVRRHVETDRAWKNGAIYVGDLPDKWLHWNIGSMSTERPNCSSWSMSLDFCPDCAPLVARVFQAAATQAGIEMSDLLKYAKTEEP